MPMPAAQIVSMIEKSIDGARVEIQDLRGDQDHYAITVTSHVFVGLTRPQQHKLVYAALEGHVGTTLHALSVTTKIEE